jgi:hypothetical protein
MNPLTRINEFSKDCCWTEEYIACHRTTKNGTSLRTPEIAEILTRFPTNDRQVVRIVRPRKTVLRLFEFLQMHRQPSFLDLLVRKHTKMRSQPKPLAHCNEPLGWIPLVPFHSIAIIHRKLVMKVVVALAESEDSSEKMVSRRMLVIEGRISQPMRERVYTKSALRNALDTSHDASIGSLHDD